MAPLFHIRVCLPVAFACLLSFGAPPPDDGGTIVLFNGSSWDGWVQRDGSSSHWVVQADGSVQAGPGDAITEREFGDFQLHLEFFCPATEAKADQAKSNSGVYLHGRYEVQVLDSFGDAPAGNGCGGIYKVAAPLVNACRPAGEWQSYDILFRAPRFDGTGARTSAARVTVLQNGIAIHNNLELPAPTPGGIDDKVLARGPLLLQDHGDPVRYRNIWVRSLD